MFLQNFTYYKSIFIYRFQQDILPDCPMSFYMDVRSSINDQGNLLIKSEYGNWLGNWHDWMLHTITWDMCDECFTSKLSRAAAATPSGYRSANGLKKIISLFIVVMDGTGAKYAEGRCLPRANGLPLGLTTTCPAECQSMRVGCPAVARQRVPGVFNTEIAEICRSRLGTKKQNGLTEAASPRCRGDIGNLVDFTSARQVAEPA